jgi:hypothetical protein
MTEKTTEQLRDERDRLLLQAEVDHLQSMLMPSPLMEQWGDYVSPRDALWTSPNNSGVEPRTSTSYDREHGDNPPFWVSEQEHADQRGIGRYLASVDESIISAIENMTNYVIGDAGSVVSFESESKPLAAACDAIWESWCDEHQFRGEMERELFARLAVDGERAVWLQPRKQRTPGFVVVEPEWVTEPNGKSTGTAYCSQCW